MFSFFRINDPYRQLFILLLLILIRIPYLFGAQTPLLEELHWIAIGNAMSWDSFLYSDLIDDTAAGSAFVYWFIDIIFGRCLLAYHWIATFLIFVQAVIFNVLLIQNKAVSENTYTFGLLYVVFTAVVPDLCTLSPPLLSFTFILLALRNIYLRMDRVLSDETIFFTGLFMGFAFIFYVPSVFLSLILFLSMLLFTSIMQRRFLLSLLGFLLPVISLFFFYLVVGESDTFFELFLLSAFSSLGPEYFSFREIIILLAVPLVFVIVSIVYVIRKVRFTNYQSRILQILSLLFAGALFTLLFTNINMPYVFIFFTASAAYFTNVMLLYVKRQWVTEVVFTLMAGVFIANPWIHQRLGHDFRKSYSREDFIRKPEQHGIFIGSSYEKYGMLSASGPFINPWLARKELRSITSEQDLVRFYESIQKADPDIIFDEENQIQTLFEKIPLLTEEYNIRDGIITK